uniref:Uncharacterized protein n=1 Tax=Avena sativa TaxID=4498 RepID=A0ACD5WY76_AVESA
MSSSEMDWSMDGDIKFRAYSALAVFGVSAVLVVCFWQLYKLTVSARPQDMLPVSSSSSGSGSGGGKALRQSDIAALPVFVHGGAAGVECAVCLAEMADGEKGRLLPGCGHRFHVECIDRWFRANSTCPLCRVAAFGEPSAVEAHKVGPVAAAPAVVVLQV